MSDPSAGGEVPRGIAAAITEVSERATSLVREEIELAKVEVAQKATRLAKGAVIGIVAGVFFLTALFFFLIGCAWLLYYYLPGNDYTFFWGFFAMAVILVVLGVLAGLIAAKAVKRGAPPTPDMAIEEARLIRETVSAPEPRPQTPPTDAPSPAGRPAPGSSPAAASPASEESTSGAPSVSGTSSVPGSASAPYGAATPPSPQEEAS